MNNPYESPDHQSNKPDGTKIRLVIVAVSISLLITFAMVAVLLFQSSPVPARPMPQATPVRSAPVSTIPVESDEIPQPEDNSKR